ncbi:HNH endonuclease [Lacticaseibacillus paracasei]|uniref:HNH endonuclease n=1 Tax=Lacticaseibacillus paracasei TaxID=1597 RepID=UPI0036D2C791
MQKHQVPHLSVKEVIENRSVKLKTTNTDHSQPSQADYSHVLSILEAQELAYIEAGRLHKLNTINPMRTLSDTIGVEEMKALYTSSFKGGSLNRDRILDSAQTKICLYCGRRDCSDLDHFLPKSVFAQFAVTPANLIPVCHQCNVKKSTGIFAEQIINPYFEDINRIPWLVCDTDISDGRLTAQFMIDFRWPDEVAPSPKFEAKIRKHFSLFKLASVYGLWANEQISAYMPGWNAQIQGGNRKDLIAHFNYEIKILDEKESNQNNYEQVFKKALLNLFERADFDECWRLIDMTGYR